MAGPVLRMVKVAFSPRYLLVTNTITCSSLLGIADGIQQYIHGDWDRRQGKPYNVWRTFRLTAIGILLGPMNHYWYRLLDSRVVFGSLSNIVAKKVTFDLAVSPVFASTFISGVSLMEGHSVIDALLEYKRKFFRVFLLDACVWPPTQAINFCFFPSSVRVLYISVVQLVYNCFLSYIKHNESDGSPTSPLEIKPYGSTAS
ncbi:hypothetical protein AB6A40_006739 [Gnathostoma spinigerum]|uniref:Mpv17-like protein 2 n=1 Tax=Gnathostoma spinigerum TaxID=75299 RepID=A0ABD6EJ75_9BILA